MVRTFSPAAPSCSTGQSSAVVVVFSCSGFVAMPIVPWYVGCYSEVAAGAQAVHRTVRGKNLTDRQAGVNPLREPCWVSGYRAIRPAHRGAKLLYDITVSIGNGDGDQIAAEWNGPVN